MTTHVTANEQIAAMNARSDTELLNKAAEIIEKEIILARGSYKGSVGYHGSKLLSRAEMTGIQDTACHCLWGAVREAAGDYSRSGGPLSLREDTFGEVRLRRLLAAIGKVLDRSKLHALSIQRAAESGDWSHVVFTYSDSVLHPMGKAGPPKAAAILRAAAASLQGGNSDG